MSDKEIEEVMDDEEEILSHERYVKTIKFIAQGIIDTVLFYEPDYKNFIIKFVEEAVMIKSLDDTRDKNGYIYKNSYSELPTYVSRSFLYHLTKKDYHTRRKFLVDLAAEFMSIPDKTPVPISNVLALVRENISSISFSFIFKERKEG